MSYTIQQPTNPALLNAITSALDSTVKNSIASAALAAGKQTSQAQIQQGDRRLKMEETNAQKRMSLDGDQEKSQAALRAAQANLMNQQALNMDYANRDAEAHFNMVQEARTLNAPSQFSISNDGFIIDTAPADPAARQGFATEMYR